MVYRDDSAAVVREHVPRMREAGAQVIVLLSHLGLGADKKLAEEVTGIDVIVGGHCHNRMPNAARVRDTLIVQAGAYGSDVGRLDLDVKDGKVVGHRRELIVLNNETVPPDPETARAMDSILARHRRKMEEVVGQAIAPLVRAQTLAGQEPHKRDEQSPADALFADVLREETGSDVALLPGVGYGVAIPAGPITAAALRNLIPHGSTVVTMTLTGPQVREVVEQSVENTYTDDPLKKVGGMIQVSGLRYRYDRKTPFGSRVGEVKVGDEPLDHQRTYKVATNSMLAEGGHNYRTLLDGCDRRAHHGQYDMVKRWIDRRGTVTTPTDRRALSADAPNEP